MVKVASFVFNPFTHDSRVLKEAISLQNAGYDITVFAHGYKDLKQEDTVQKINVKRFSYFDRTVTKNPWKKVTVYLTYAYQAASYAKSFQVLHCHDLNTLPIGVIIKAIFNRQGKVIYDAHEYETEVGRLGGLRKTLLKLFERLLIKYADKVITVSDAIADEYVRLYGIVKPTLVLNTPVYQEIEKKDIFRDKLGIDKEQNIFLYQGGISKGRGVEILLESFAQIKQNNVVVFMGYGPLESLVKEYAEKYENIYFHEAVSPDVLLKYTSSADFGISTIENSCLSYYYCLPNKMFEYLMAEIPVIVSNLYEMKKIVEEKQVGVVAKENSPQGLRDAVSEILKLDRKALKENIQKVKAEYNWEKQEEELIQLYKDLLV